MEIFTWGVSSATAAEVTPRILSARFGDGYEQNAKDGEHSILRNWNVNFDPIHATDAYGDRGSLEEISDFLEARAGAEKFLWTQPPPFDVEGSKIFLCKSWNFTYDRGLQVGLRATFLQQPI